MEEKNPNPHVVRYGITLRTRALGFSIFSEFNSWFGFVASLQVLFTLQTSLLDGADVPLTWPILKLMVLDHT